MPLLFRDPSHPNSGRDDMKVISQRFTAWLMSLTTIMRYFVIALLVHIAAVFVLASIKIAVAMPAMIQSVFNPSAVPPPKDAEPDDPLTPLRDYDYKGKETGDGGGTPGIGPGGIPTAAGNTPTEYKASIMDSQPSDSQVSEVIGVVADIGAVVRPAGSPGGIAGPTTGMGDKLIGTAGVWGPGGGGFGHRLGARRGQLISKYKRWQEMEKAVIAGLRWLKSKQQPDGSWDGPMDRNGHTALAMLAFLGHGETTESPEFGETVNKGLQYLIKIIGQDGLVPGNQHRAYSQGAVTLVLSEAYGMTGSPAVKEPLERAVKGVLAWQNDVGAWRYQFKQPGSDVSTSGWLIMALKSAKLAGIEVPEEAFDKATKYLWTMYHPNGGFGYNVPAQRPSTTAIGVLCLQYMKRDDDNRISKALVYLKNFKSNWQESSDGGFNLVLYWWYYHSQAMFQAGGGYWDNWYPQMSDTMIKNQKEDGHWEYPDKSSFEKTQLKEAGYVYSTALCILNLEVFYRYLPMHKQLEKAGGPAVPGSVAPK